MKLFSLLLFFITLTSGSSQYQQVQIDMHGGKDDYSYQQNYNSFSSGNIIRFLDKNTTKKDK